MADADPLHMTLPDLLAFVAALEAKYQSMPPRLIHEGTPRWPPGTQADLVRLRASLQGCVAALDRLLVE